MPKNDPIEIDQLFGGLNPSEENDKWFVVHTKPRQEKKLAHYCKQRNINYFLPLQDSVRVYKRRKVTFTKPVFPSYIFLRSSPEQRSILFRSDSIVRFLNVVDEEELLNDLENIHTATSQNQPVERHPYITEGNEVEVLNGPFKGVQGLVIDSSDATKLVIGIHLINEAVCVDIDPKDIKVTKKK